MDVHHRWGHDGMPLRFYSESTTLSPYWWKVLSLLEVMPPVSATLSSAGDNQGRLEHTFWQLTFFPSTNVLSVTFHHTSTENRTVPSEITKGFLGTLIEVDAASRTVTLECVARHNIWLCLSKGNTMHPTLKVCFSKTEYIPTTKLTITTSKKLTRCILTWNAP
jgi:hypothetical protein